MPELSVRKRSPGRRPIPVGWKSVALGSVASTQYGLSTAPSEGGTVPMVGMRNLVEGKVSLRDLPRVELSKADLDACRLDDGDILFNRTNSADLVGKSAVFRNGQGGPFVFASYLVRVAVDRRAANPEFVCLFINSEFGQRRLRALATPGVSQYNINPTNLRTDFLLPLPPRREQDQIVEVIKTWDESISQATRLLDYKRQLKKGLVQLLLTGRRRLVRTGSGVRRVQGRFYSYPSDWQHPQLKEVADDISERNMARNALPVLLCSKYRGLVNSRDYFDRQVHSDDTSSYKIVRKGQFCYPANHVEEGSIGLLDHVEAGLVSPIYIVFSVDARRVHAPYLYALFKTETYRHIFAVTTNSSVDRRGSLRWKEFSAIHVPLPSLEEQLEIARVLGFIDRELELLIRKLDSLRSQKRGLMQKLLMGRVRVGA